MPEQQTQNPDFIEKLGTVWCILMHNSPMWPIHRNYECRSCGRRYPIPWDANRVATRIIHTPNVGLAR